MFYLNPEWSQVKSSPKQMFFRCKDVVDLNSNVFGKMATRRFFVDFKILG